MILVLKKNAIERIKFLLQQDQNLYALRFSVKGGGCSGFSYQYDLVSHQDKPKYAQDLVIEQEGARLLLDKNSIIFIQGSKLDFIDNIIQQSFVVENPNAVSSCGCGDSFSI